ncbi:hypothetical protein VTK73DRAFT_6469 [Phialemonium thermophilum]|uniref:Secreted protein n=1 Tax=Phialemonium thermophilum TaxID=223376 RepID=A0ABR3UZD5_9PEZI
MVVSLPSSFMIAIRLIYAFVYSTPLTCSLVRRTREAVPFCLVPPPRAQSNSAGDLEKRSRSFSVSPTLFPVPSTPPRSPSSRESPPQSPRGPAPAAAR